MSNLRVRALDEGELDDAEELLRDLPRGDEARTSLARLGGVDEKTLALGDGWAALVEIDGVTLLVRGEPHGAGAKWIISAAANVESGAHAAERLAALMSNQR
jgi:hypothetical protein